MTEDDNQQPSAEETGPLTESAAADLLSEWRDEPEQKESPVSSARANARTAEEQPEETAVESDPEAEPEADASPEGEEPLEGDTDAEESDDIYVHGNARTRLRDGSVVSVGELKKLADEAREFRRREDDFTAKQREFATKSAQIAQQEQFISATLQQATTALQNRLPAEPDPRLLETDPIAFHNQNYMRQRALQEIAQLNQAQQVQTQQAQAEQAEQFHQHIESEKTRLYERAPELRDEGKRRQFFNEMQDLAREYGFTENDINSIHDHRTMLLVKDALAYRKLQAAKPKVAEKVKNARPVTKPGQRAPSGNVSTQHREKFSRFAKSRSVDDAGALLADLD